MMTATINTNEANSLLDWLTFIELSFKLHKNSNKTPEFKDNLAKFEDFYKQYKQYKQYAQNGNSTKTFFQYEIKATLVLADMDEALLDEILKWDGKICLNQQFNSPSDLLQCTNYKELETIFSSRKPTSNGGRTITSYLHHQKAYPFTLNYQ